MTVLDIDAHEHRETEHEIDPIFVERWSPRAMSGEPVTREELMRLFEAARWAPSSYNGQPWRFVYALRDTDAWDRFFPWMVEFNQGWTKNAGALVLVVSRKTFEHNGKPATTHSFDTGAAWQNLALQGTRQGLVVHAMQGFDYDAAAETLDLPDHYAVECLVAVGRPGEADSLGDDLAEQEKPNGRKSVAEIAFEGGLPADA